MLLSRLIRGCKREKLRWGVFLFVFVGSFFLSFGCLDDSMKTGGEGFGEGGGYRWGALGWMMVGVVHNEWVDVYGKRGVLMGWRTGWMAGDLQLEV